MIEIKKAENILKLQEKFKILNSKKIKKQNDICFVEENKTIIYSIMDNKIYTDTDKQESIKKYIIMDTLIDIKIISVPVVSSRMLKNIIINTVKKHSPVIPTEKNTDYIILDKEENKYEILVFIKLFNNEKYNKKQLFSIYHITDNLIKDPELPNDSSFLVEVNDTWVLYSYKEKKFKKRIIYYKNDINNLKKHNVYFINIFKKENNYNFNEIKQDKLNYALSKLNNQIFKEQKEVKPKKALLFLMLIFCIFGILFLQFQSYQLSIKKRNLTDDLKRLTKIFEEEKSKRGISDEVYKEYLNLFSKKSNVNIFLKNLYLAGNNNIEITKLLYEEGMFAITGYCTNDFLLENQFRESEYWKDVSFSFTKKNSKIQFNIKGHFINE